MTIKRLLVVYDLALDVEYTAKSAICIQSRYELTMFGIDHFFFTTISRQSVDFIAYYFITFEFSTCGLVFFADHKSPVISAQFYEIFISSTTISTSSGVTLPVVNTPVAIKYLHLPVYVHIHTGTGVD
jgi:hypothetical protein